MQIEYANYTGMGNITGDEELSGEKTMRRRVLFICGAKPFDSHMRETIVVFKPEQVSG